MHAGNGNAPFFVLDHVVQLCGSARRAARRRIPARTRLRTRPVLHAAMVFAQFGRALGYRGALGHTCGALYRLDQCRQRRLSIAGDRQIHRHKPLHVLVIRFRQSVAEGNVDDFDIGFGQAAIFVVRIANGVELPPRIGDLEHEHDIGLSDQ